MYQLEFFPNARFIQPTVELKALYLRYNTVHSMREAGNQNQTKQGNVACRPRDASKRAITTKKQCDQSKNS